MTIALGHFGKTIGLRLSQMTLRWITSTYRRVGLLQHDKDFSFPAGRPFWRTRGFAFWGAGFIRVLKKYSEEYKLTVVREIERCGSVTAVERTIGIQRSLLYRWYKKLRGAAWGREQRSGEAGDGGEQGVATASVLRPWKRFSDEFKMAAVRAVEGGKSVPEVA